MPVLHRLEFRRLTRPDDRQAIDRTLQGSGGNSDRSSVAQRRWLLVLCAAVQLLTAPLGAQATDALRAHKLPAERPAAMKVDGLLTEPEWQAAPVIADFKQREPLEGVPATEATEIRILYDANTMYVGVLARDREPDAIIARILARDRLMEPEFDGKPRFGGDDGIAILLDPFHDHRNAFVFATNPNGAEFDALITDEGRGFNVDWRGVWYVAAKRVREGWSAEFAIPFRTLRYPANPATWGFNAYRVIRRKNEEVLWTSWSRNNEGFARVSRAGHLEGREGLREPGRNADIRPYVLAGHDRTRPDGVLTNQGLGDVGVELKSEVRPGLVLDLTYNTDFAQVEVDDQQVNLTRFNLFFPEKRDFFLENSGIFDFGARGSFEPPPFQLFFSRNIGINPAFGEVPMLGGGRLSGRVGNQTVGLLTAVNGAKYGEPATLFNVGRVKRDLGSANYIGGMVVDRRSDSTWNTATGADFSWWPKGALNLQGFVASTATEGSGGDGIAYRLGTDYQANLFGFSASHLAVGEEANPAAGFVTRTNIRRSQSNTRLTWRPSTFLNLRRVNLLLWTDHVADMDWRRLDYSTTLGFRPLWNTEDGVGFFYTKGRNRIVAPFSLTGQVVVNAGDYLHETRSLFVNTGRARPLVADLMVDLEKSYGGTIDRATLTITTNPGKHLALRSGYSFSKADMPNGAFEVHLVSLRAGWTFNTRVALNSLIQYNSLAKSVSANVRLNIIHRPGSDIFVVLNEERGSDVSTWDPRNRAMRLKVTYLARL